MIFEVQSLGVDKAADMARLYGQCFNDAWEESFFVGKLRKSCFAKGIILKEKLIGFIFVQSVEDEAEILTFCIHENHRGQGFGKMLLSEVLKQSRINSCFLEVRSDNKPAIALYQRLGFIKQGERKGYYQGRKQESQKLSHDAIIYVYSKN